MKSDYTKCCPISDEKQKTLIGGLVCRSTVVDFTCQPQSIRRCRVRPVIDKTIAGRFLCIFAFSDSESKKSGIMGGYPMNGKHLLLCFLLIVLIAIILWLRHLHNRK